MSGQFGLNELLTLLACPACRRELAWTNDSARCPSCQHIYPIRDGIPMLVLDEATADRDELTHPHDEHQHKRQQAAFFDQDQAAEFEISRPHGTPALYSWFLGDKFQRSIAALEQLLPKSTALAVCAGSGMDAEFLAKAGARVISSDLSWGAARRARERAKRYGLNLLPIVADVEQLPFRSRAIDLVYVHDGLHHLERPLKGLAEMARVAVRAVSITEPAEAAVTRVAVKLGLALEREQAGNRVMRLTIPELSRKLQDAGFRTVRAERYLMYYKHEPGALFRQLSRPMILPLVKRAYRAANAVGGDLGNKLTVQALRNEFPVAASDVQVTRRWRLHALFDGRLYRARNWSPAKPLSRALHTATS